LQHITRRRLMEHAVEEDWTSIRSQERAGSCILRY
jgi:hypothetical protein